MKNHESANPAATTFSANVSIDSGTTSFSRLRGQYSFTKRMNVSIDSGTTSFSRLRGQYSFTKSHSLPGGRSRDVGSALSVNSAPDSVVVGLGESLAEVA